MPQENVMCNLRVVTKRNVYDQKNLMLTDIEVGTDGVVVKTQLGFTMYHVPNIEMTEITYIDKEG
jgi:hypothetical protein